jgi:hypothetical protein
MDALPRDSIAVYLFSRRACCLCHRRRGVAVFPLHTGHFAALFLHALRLCFCVLSWWSESGVRCGRVWGSLSLQIVWASLVFAAAVR